MIEIDSYRYGYHDGRNGVPERFRRGVQPAVYWWLLLIAFCVALDIYGSHEYSRGLRDNARRQACSCCADPEWSSLDERVTR